MAMRESREIPLLSIDELSVEFRTRDGIVKALEGVTFSVRKGETVGVVGESGSGKSVTALAVLGLLPAAARITTGTAVFGGLDLLQATSRQLEECRGREVSMIFQNPRTALNPIRTVGQQIVDVLERHANVLGVDATGRGKHVRARAVELLSRVKIPDPERRFGAYPFELSGGMCQRMMIALALACSPSLLIADEPTTGIDVTTQAAILDLLRELGSRSNMATVLITHDLGVVAERCDRIVVMHAGHVVETAPAGELFARPRHPYTRRLIASTPRPGAKLADLMPIPGSVPDLRRALPPCRYRGRCERALPECDTAPLPQLELTALHRVACHHPLEDATAA